MGVGVGAEVDAVDVAVIAADDGQPGRLLLRAGAPAEAPDAFDAFSAFQDVEDVEGAEGEGSSRVCRAREGG